MDVERTIQFILEHEASTAAKLEELAQWRGRHEKEMAEMRAEFRAELRRAIRLSVEEHRRERVRRQQANAEFDDKITKLAAAQLLGEEQTRRLEASLQRFLDSRQGRNGDQ